MMNFSLPVHIEAKRCDVRRSGCFGCTCSTVESKVPPPSTPGSLQASGREATCKDQQQHVVLSSFWLLQPRTAESIRYIHWTVGNAMITQELQYPNPEQEYTFLHGKTCRAKSLVLNSKPDGKG
jgi:hypothetical protein